MDLLVSRYARYYIFFRRDDYLYVNPHPALPTRQIRVWMKGVLLLLLLEVLEAVRLTQRAGGVA